MAVAHLRGKDNFGAFGPGIVNGEHGVGQNHEPAAQPADMLLTDETFGPEGDPIDEPIGADVNGPGAGSQQEEIDWKHPAEIAVAAGVGFEDFKDMETLPEKEERDEDEAVAEINFAIGTKHPGGAGEEDYGNESQQQREAIDFAGGRAFVGSGGFFGGVFFAGEEIEVPKDCGQAENERHVGDIIDEAISHDFGSRAALAAENERED